MKQFKWMYQYTKKCRFSWFTGHMLLSVLEFITAFNQALVFKYIYQSFDTRSVDILYLALIISIADFALYCVGIVIADYLKGRSLAIIRSELQKDLLQKILKVPMNTLNETHSGELMAYFNQDVDLAVQTLDKVIQQMIMPIVLGIGYLIIALFMVWEMGLYYVITMTPIIFIGVHYAPIFKKIGKKVQESLSFYNERVTDFLAGFVTIKQYSLEDRIDDIGQMAAKNIYDVRCEEIEVSKKYRARLNIWTHIYATLPIILGCVMVTLKRALLENVMFVSRYTFRIRNISRSIITMSSDLQFQLAAVDRLMDVSTYKQEYTSDASSLPIDHHQKAISISNLDVNYDNKHVLKQLNLDILSNQVTAIIGGSGSGKSTLLKSFMKFVEYQGYISLFGHDCHELGVNQIRNHIAYVSQEHDLIDGTILENILYGKLDASLQEVEKVCMEACVNDFLIDLPQGLDTIVGENGCNLSGGQRQRVAIARALLKDSEILILDEATSALDYDLEHKILFNIKEYYKDKTIIICTHRLSTIENADQIVVIEDGCISEQGTHQELMSKEGTYHNLLSYML